MHAPPDFSPSTPPADPVDGVASQWAALNEAGDMVAALCGVQATPITPEMREFPARMRELQGVRREMAENGIADLMAMMEPGIAALVAIRATGADPTPAATTLWHEFDAARSAIMALLLIDTPASQ